LIYSSVAIIFLSSSCLLSSIDYRHVPSYHTALCCWHGFLLLCPSWPQTVILPISVPCIAWNMVTTTLSLFYSLFLSEYSNSNTFYSTSGIHSSTRSILLTRHTTEVFIWFMNLNLIFSVKFPYFSLNPLSYPTLLSFQSGVYFHSLRIHSDFLRILFNYIDHV
jgi:hypothetical protein